INNICDWIKQNEVVFPRKGICHGSRNGLEGDEFIKHLDKIDVFGTDLFPFSGKSKKNPGNSRVVKQDFSKQKRHWINKFDMIYSNSLDHAFDPLKTLTTWFQQLTLNGYLFVQWTKSHTNAHGGDCFGGQLHEWIDIINEKGKVVDLIYTKVPFKRKSFLQRRAIETIVIVSKRKK
ncbi:hypothetical protein KAR91_28550, partial [Candidatus Pacearchaeota archaeon]|nr:hypothetical protein [Candidatus Pacearchaeota archaeon]